MKDKEITSFRLRQFAYAKLAVKMFFFIPDAESLRRLFFLSECLADEGFFMRKFVCEYELSPCGKLD